MKKVFVILVALDFQNFEHYWKEPKVFYENFEEALEQMNHLLHTKQYEETQLKIQKLWTQTNSS